MTNTVETVDHSISQSLALMTTMMNPAQLAFVIILISIKMSEVIMLNKRI